MAFEPGTRNWLAYTDAGLVLHVGDRTYPVPDSKGASWTWQPRLP